MTIFVIQLSLLLISKNIIGFGYFLEFFLCLRITRIRIRMILLGKLSICSLNSRFICAAVYSEYFVVITLHSHVHLQTMLSLFYMFYNTNIMLRQAFLQIILKHNQVCGTFTRQDAQKRQMLFHCICPASLHISFHFFVP